MNKIFIFFTVLSLILLTPVLVNAEVLYDFDTSIDAWVTENWEWGAPTLKWSDFNGGSLEIDTSTIKVNKDNWAKFFVKADEDQDFTSNPLYSLDIFIPKGFYYCKVKLIVRAGSDWVSYESERFKLENNSTWQNICFDLSDINDLNRIRQVAIEIEGFMSEKPVIYIDNVSAK